MSAAAEPSPARARAARATMHELSADADVFQTFFDAARTGLALADLSGRYVRVNLAYAELLGCPPEDLVGVALASVLGELAVEELVGGGQDALSRERQHVRGDGTVVWLLHGVTTVAGGDGRPAWLAVSAQDVTERRSAEQELREMTAALTERAVRDPLTGLANRALLEERLRTALARDARSGDATGVLFLDLDGFKAVNDQHGHAVGDAVLRAVAERLAAAVRPGDTVARLGGDEFVVLVESATPAALDRLAVRLAEAVARPVRVDGLQLAVGASVGSAVSHAGAEDPQGLLSAADARMYAAKRASR